MPETLEEKHERYAGYYGAFAYGAVTVTCYASFLGHQRTYSSEWLVPVVFGLGALHVAVAVLAGQFGNGRGSVASALYYFGQCALVTTILALSPIRGFIGILVLPLMSQAIFDLRARFAILVGVYLFGINIALFAIPYGWEGAMRAVLNFGAAFVFTAVFSVIARQAIAARLREQKLRADVEEANRQLRDHAAQAEDLATTRERNRVAREIHDGVGHYLTVVKTQLDAATALLPSQPERAREAVLKAASLTGEALDDVRRSVGALRADATRSTLSEALRGLAQEADLPVRICVVGAERTLPPGVAHALFRAAQEGLTNVRKHAAGSAAEVAVDFVAPDRVRLAITDNGKGANGSTNARGFGLLGMRERIEVLGGRVESGNRGGAGFSLTIEVPA
jgi:signal transduction histidine kinase